MGKALGVVKLKLDGTLVHSKPGASIDIGGPVRSAVESDQPGYYSETNKGSRIEADLVVDKDFSADDLRRMDDITATFEADTGQSWVVNHAYVAESGPITGGNSGGCRVIIEGPPAQEMK